MKYNIDNAVKILRIVLILFFWSWFLVWFSIRSVRKPAHTGNFAEQSIIFAGEAPGTVKNWLTVTSTGLEHQEVLLPPDLKISPLGELQNLPVPDDRLYLLHYRYEGGRSGKVYLQNIKDGRVEKSWRIPLDEIFEDLQALKKQLTDAFVQKAVPLDVTNRVTNNIAAIQVNSPILGEDSSLLFNCGSLGYLYKLDKDSKLVWKSKEPVHHSIELDDQGNIWTCSANLEHPLAKKYAFREDAVLCLDANGRRREFYSLSDILSENDLFNTVVAATPAYREEYGQDPYHLNDVLPVKTEGKFWKKGDLFLSIRHKSTVIQYRPRDGKVVWHQQGPWLAQHDINLVGDSAISVFNNNALLMPNQIADEGSSIAYFDFNDGTTKHFGEGLFASTTEGRQTRTVKDCILVEETNKGVYLFLDSSGAAMCRFYIPYHSNPSHAMNPTWARLYLQSDTEFLRQ